VSSSFAIMGACASQCFGGIGAAVNGASAGASAAGLKGGVQFHEGERNPPTALPLLTSNSSSSWVRATSEDFGCPRRVSLPARSRSFDTLEAESSRRSSAGGGSGHSNCGDLRAEVLQAVSNCQNSVALEHVLRILQTSALTRRSLMLTPAACPLRVGRINTMAKALECLHHTTPPRIGLDIGGTLAKMVIMHPADLEESLVEKFDQHSKHADLAFRFCMDDEEYSLQFLSGETSKLGRYLESATESTASTDKVQKVVVSGGGAHKFAESMRKTSSVEMVPFQEMESLVAGLEFLSEHNPEGEVFEVDEGGSRQPFVLPAVQDMFPCLLVNMGSGVSILRIDGPSEDAERSQRYQRIGGTACGGKTFLGLMRRITSATSFKEMLELAQHGDASRVNTLVADIYGEKGCAALGLPPSHTAAYFGKWPSSASSPSEAAFYPATAEADCAAALLLMVVQESVVLSRALSLLISAQVGNDYKPPVFFVGGFLAQNIAAQRIISRSYHNLNLGPALFLRHADFLGALGCLNKSLEKDHASASP